MKNINNDKEQVEVMALFGYKMTPCRPLSFKRRGERTEVEVTGLLQTKIRFAGNAAIHIFDVVAEKTHYVLEFNSLDLVWSIARA